MLFRYLAITAVSLFQSGGLLLHFSRFTAVLSLMYLYIHSSVKANAVGVTGRSLGESVVGLPFLHLCATVALLRPSGLSYALSVTCLRTGPAPLLAYASDSCWGRDVKCITKSPAGAAHAVMM